MKNTELLNYTIKVLTKKNLMKLLVLNKNGKNSFWRPREQILNLLKRKKDLQKLQKNK